MNAPLPSAALQPDTAPWQAPASPHVAPGHASDVFLPAPPGERVRLQRTLPRLPLLGHLSLTTQAVTLGGTGLVLLLGSGVLILSAGGSQAILGAGLTVFVLAFVTILLLAYTCVVEALHQASQSARESQRHEAAIMRLLNEMGDLAEGDLTVRAEVTEDITGAIADSMNFAVEELRTLVVGVERGARRLSGKSDAARLISGQMLLAAQNQSERIHAAGSEIHQLLGSIHAVSLAAGDAMKVAQHSTAAAGKGGEAANDTIRGMAEIRTQIQDTAKRIKRLGERSQEIGEIVELIAGISEQTNLLALNASLQAAAAGEAGRGFSLVAEEVQQLAERSAEATRAIGTLVVGIRNDTSDAMMAMERSTADVVEGARRADAAGRALEEIQQVTHQQAALIRAISSATDSQAAVTGQISRHIEEVLQMTQVVGEGATGTATAVGDLFGLAADLRGSIAGFRL